MTPGEPALPPEPRREMATASSSNGQTINGTGSLNHSDDSSEPEGDSSNTAGQEAMWPSESPVPPDLLPQPACTRGG